MKKLLFFIGLFCSGIWTNAQTDTLLLQTANLSDAYFLKFSETQPKQILNDSILQKNSVSLTDLLNYNSVVYFKENGAGMVSSPSFRGTTASQTAVIWNGINLNSQMNGQSDFNTINTMAFDHIAIKAGGGSAGYGSGAIGGSILLNNELTFNQGWKNQLQARYGSYHAYSALLKSAYSNDQISLQFSGGRSASDNDHKILGTDRKNKNGQFYNQLFNVAAAYKISPKHSLKFYGNLYDGERHFSLISEHALATKYHDYHTRTMLEWDGKLNRFNSNLKLAHLNEKFRYYPTLQTVQYEFGEVDSYWIKYDLGYQYKNLHFAFLSDYQYAEATGSSIKFAKKQRAALGFLMKHKLTSKFLYELSVRQEFDEVYDAPLLYSAGIQWKALPFYQFSLNSSKNFRSPTFNDLYWPGSGNLDLKSETSLQAEMNHLFHGKNWSIGLNAYYNSVENLIQWVPTGIIHTPENVGQVNIYGFEALINLNKNWHKHHLDFNATYAYTVSENDDTGKQLIYVPFHKSTASLAYNGNKLTTYYQLLYIGQVYTDSRNQNKLDAYTVSNFGADYNLGKSFKIGAQVLNLWNEDYQNTLNRPMPGRNYNVYLQINF